LLVVGGIFLVRHFSHSGRFDNKHMR
jgi:hypothetical protein